MSVPTTLTVFSYTQFERLVREFAETTPALLLRHRETATLAFAVERLNLAQSLDTRFTVAIIGQMRVGKSTLLNALIGRRLAPTGVNETTATVNWFRHGTGELCAKFRVHWTDGSSDDYPLERVEQWVGQSKHVDRTRALDFFADSEFLKVANIVDTPGTRSVLQAHESAVQGFLADKLEAETKRHCGRADAIVYVINPVARQDDKELLALFGERTRLPGASAYNSIAVMQKWEHLNPDPLREAQRKCERLRIQLQGKVAEVIPVSGMLANLASELPLEHWADMSRLATASEASALDDLLLAERYFSQEAGGVALDVAARQALLTQVQWPALRFCVKLARDRSLDSAESLHQAVLNASGIETLKALLRSRFFALAGLIKASTVLRKAWQPCDQALLMLRDLVEQRRHDLQRAGRVEQVLRDLAPANPALGEALAYVTSSKSAVENDQRRVEESWEDLDAIRSRAEAGFRFLDADIACLESLERLSEEELDDVERAELHRLFGGEGPEVRRRLGLAPDTPLDRAAEERVWDRKDHWAVRRAQVARETARLCEHAVDCLDRILDVMEHEKHD
jgi:hypothetical protein